MEMKTCIMCCKSKLKVEFNSKQSRCKDCQSLYKKDYYAANKKYINQKSKEWRNLNPDRNRELKRNWEYKDRAAWRARRRIKEAEWRKTNPQLRLALNMRRRLNHMLHGRASKSSQELLGCSYIELKDYIESLFTPGMTWENYGDWHVDHIYPLSKVDLTNPDELARVCHYTNLQPLWAEDNLRKAAKVLESIELSDKKPIG